LEKESSICRGNKSAGGSKGGLKKKGVEIGLQAEKSRKKKK
jgi:hypothetical protein